MLAKLFNNISIPSLARALAFLVTICVVSVIFYTAPPSTLHLGFPDIALTPFWFFTLLLIFIPGLALAFNTGINQLGFLKNDYQVIPIFGLILLPVFLLNGNVALLLSMPFIILLMLRLMWLVKSIDPSYILFDAGVLIGLSALLVPELLFFMLIAWLATINFGHFNIRTFLMPIIGLSAIYFFLFTLLYWIFDINGLEYLLKSIGNIVPGFHFSDIRKVWVYIPLAISALPALLETTQVYGKANVQKRQIFTFLSLSFLLLLLGGVFIEISSTLWIWTALPISAFVVNLIHYRRKAWQRDIYYLLLLIFWSLVIFF